MKKLNSMCIFLFRQNKKSNIMNTSTFLRRTMLTMAVILFAFAGQAQTKRLKPYLSTTTYCAPGVSPYVENAIAFECRTATYRQFEPGKFKATVEVQTIFRQGEKICAYSKIALDSPVVTDTSKLDGAFIDQQRFALPNGDYEMEISITDMNSGDALPVGKTNVELKYPDNTPSVSDILLYDSYNKAAKPSSCTKSGMDFLPRVYPFYGPQTNKLHFYAEVYNSNKLYYAAANPVCDARNFVSNCVSA